MLPNGAHAKHVIVVDEITEVVSKKTGQLVRVAAIRDPAARTPGYISTTRLEELMNAGELRGTVVFTNPSQ